MFAIFMMTFKNVAKTAKMEKVLVWLKINICIL